MIRIDRWLVKTGALARDSKRLSARIAPTLMTGGVHGQLVAMGATGLATAPHRRDPANKPVTSNNDSLCVSGESHALASEGACDAMRVRSP